MFEEIFVGERNRAIGLLGSSLPDQQSRRLAHHLDLPGQPPQGFELTTYVSGALIGDSYVITRTSADLQAERSGMVFSHALVIDGKAIGELNDLRSVFQLLCHQRTERQIAASRVVEVGSVSYAPPPGPICDMITTRVESAVVASDPAWFEDLCARIWSRLLPTMRADFKFGMSFDPEEAARQGLHFALVPQSTLPRWPAERRADGIRDDAPARTAAGQYLADADNGRLARFVEDLEIETVRLASFGRLGRAYELSSDVGAPFLDTLNALRLVGLFQPLPAKGLRVKTPLLHRAFEADEPLKIDDMLALRNFDWSPFPKGSVTEKKLVSIFCKTLQAADARGKQIDIVKSALDEAAATQEWRKIGCEALSHLDGVTADALAPAAWELLSRETGRGRSLLETCPSLLFDAAMAKTPPEPSKVPHERLSQTLAESGYFAAEAALLRKRYKNDDLSALHEACGRDRAKFGDSAINIILRALPARDVVRGAETIDDPLVAEMAATHVAEKPSLLQPFDVAQPRIQGIWRLALSKSPEAWQIADTPAVQRQLFTALSEPGVDAALMARLMETPLGDWFECEDRAKVWDLLDAPAKKSALARTAATWIAVYPGPEGSITYLSPETPLAAAIAEPSLANRLLAALVRGSFDQTVAVFLGNEHISSDLFVQAVTGFRQPRHPLTRHQAERAGQLISARKWHSATRTLLSRLGVPSDLRPLFDICADHLSIWNRIIYGLKAPTRGELFELFVTVACDLYPGGPQERDIWVRANGDPSRLDLTGVGRTQWRAALQLTRRGGGVDARKLIEVMLEDYPLNSQLQHLAEAL